MTESSTDAVRSDQPDGVVEDKQGNVTIGAPTAIAIVETPMQDEEN